MKTRKVTLGLVQTKVSEDVRANIAKTEKFIRKAARRGAQIICLQELYNATYFPQQPKHDVSKFLETVPGRSTKRFSKLAKELGVVIIVPMSEKRKNGKTYNSAVVIDADGKLMRTYDKIHIPHDPGFYEKDYFEEGNNSYQIYKTKFATFAVFICFDQWFPELARMARLNGAEIIFYPTAIGDLIGYVPKGNWHEAWETVQRGHAIANNLVVAAVNRVGREGNVTYWGQSFVVGPFGEVLGRGSKTKEQAVIVKVDLADNKYFYDGWGFLQNRRPEIYADLLSNRLVKKSKKLRNVAHYKAMKKALGEK